MMSSDFFDAMFAVGVRLSGGSQSFVFENYEPKPSPINAIPSFTFLQENVVKTVKRLKLECASGDLTILNFASGTRPGGGVRRGTVAQEEDLCRASDLLRHLESEEVRSFYQKNIEMKDTLPEYSEDLIYSEDVCFFETPPLSSSNFHPDDFIAVGCADVITCAAPNLNRGGLEFTRPLKDIIQDRANRIVAIANAKRTRTLVLGAWGCGVFGNDPKTVAIAFKNAIKNYGGNITHFVFPILDLDKLKVFEQILKPKHRVYLLETLSPGRGCAQVHHVAEVWAAKYPLHMGTVIIHACSEKELLEIEKDLVTWNERYASFREPDLGDKLTVISTYREYNYPLLGTSRRSH